MAQAGDHTLTVDEMVSLLQVGQGIPNNEEVVRLVADLWVDYTLLAEFSQQDSSFQDFDVSSLVDAQLGTVIGFLTAGMLLSLPLIAIGVWLILRARSTG